MKTNRGLICAMTIGMLSAVLAGPVSGATNTACQRTHKDPGFGGPCMAEFKQLNLTADQSQQIAAIMNLNREAIKTVKTAAREARQALNQQIHAGSFDEQAVRAICKQVAAAEEEDAVLRAKAAVQIHAVLTGEQQAALEKIRADRHNAMQKRFAGECGKIGK